MPSIEVTSLSDAGIAEDFSFAEVTFATQAGASMRCRFKPKALDMIIAQHAQVMPHIRNNTVSEGGYATPPITLASDTTATALAEGSHVVLSRAATVSCSISPSNRRSRSGFEKKSKSLKLQSGNNRDKLEVSGSARGAFTSTSELAPEAGL